MKAVTAKIIGIICAIVFSLVALFSYLSSEAFSSSLGEKVSEIAGEALATKIEIGDIAVESFHTVGAKNIAVYDKQGGEIARADYVQVEFSLFGLLKNNPLEGISDISVTGVNASIIQREDGTFNFEDLISETESKNYFTGKIHVNEAAALLRYDGMEAQLEDVVAAVDLESFPAVDFEGSAVNQGARVKFHGNVNSAENTCTVEAEDVCVENYLKYVPDGIIPAEVQDIKGTIPKAKATIVNIGQDIYYSGEAELTDGEAVVLDKKVENIKGLFVLNERKLLAFARASCEGQEVYAHGNVLLDTGKPVLDIVAETKDFEPAKILNNGDFSGKVNVAAHITGVFDNPVVDADVNVREAQAEGYTLNNLTAKVHYADSHVYAKDIDVAALGGKVTGEAEFYAKDLSFTGHFKVDNIELSALQKTGVPVSGTVSGDIAADGVADDLNKLNIYGSVFSDGITYSGIDEGRKSIHADSIRTSFAKLGNKVTVDFLSAKMENGGILGLKGDILLNESLNLEFLGANIDLSKFIVSLDGSEKNPFAGRMDIKASISGPIDNPVVKAEFAALNGKLYFQPFDKLRGSVAGSVRGMKIEDFAMDHGQSRWTVDGMMGYRDVKGSFLKNNLLDMGIRLNVHIRDARMEDLVRPISADIPVTGNLDKDMVVTGKLGNPHIEGQLHFYEGSVGGMFMQKVDGSYTVDNVNDRLVLNVKGIHAETPWINMDVKGTVYDLQSTPVFDLQLKTNDVLLDDFTDRMPYPLTGHARFDGNLTGTVKNPVFEGAMTADAININGVAVNSAGGKVSYKNNLLSFDNFGFKDGSGDYKLDGTLNMENNAINSVMQINKADIASFLAMSNMKNDKIHGHADGKVVMTGSIDSIRKTDISNTNDFVQLLKAGLLDTINIKVNLNVNDGVAAGYAVSGVEADMELKDSILNINSFKGNEGEKGRFAAAGTINLKDSIKAEISLTDIDTGMIAGIAGADAGLGGTVNCVVQCAGTMENPVADISAEALNTTMNNMKLDKAYTIMHFENGVINIKDMAAEKYIRVGETDAVYRGFVKGTVPLAAFSADENVCSGSSMDVTVSLDDADLSLLPSIADNVEWAFGETDGRIHITGNRLKPNLNGSIRIHGNRINPVSFELNGSNKKKQNIIDTAGDDGASIKVKGLDTVVENVSMLVAFTGNTVKLDHLSGNIGKGDFKVTGDIVLNGSNIDDYDLSIECNKLDIQTAFYRGKADLSLDLTKATMERVEEWFKTLRSPDENKSESEKKGTEDKDKKQATPWLNYAGAKEDFKKRIEGRQIISGRLALEDAVISIPSIVSSDDPLPNIFMNLDLVIGDNVSFYVPQLANLQLAGSAHIGGTMHFPRSSGSIYVKKGTINYLKNSFKVREAALLFNQGFSFLPAIKLSADTKIGSRKVFINIDGPLFGNHEDMLKLSSNPELSEENIIKLLTLRGAYKENSENSWGEAAGSMAITGLQMALLGDVEESLKNSLKLDYFSIERDFIGASDVKGASGSGNKEVYNVIIGKNLSDKTMLKVGKSVNTNDYKAVFEYEFNDKINFNIGQSSEKGTTVGFEATFTF